MVFEVKWKRVNDIIGKILQAFLSSIPLFTKFKAHIFVGIFFIVEMTFVDFNKKNLVQ